MSRDPARIDRVLALVKAAWERQPDLRLTQLLWNTAAHQGDGPAPGFFMTEDDRLAEAFHAVAPHRRTACTCERTSPRDPACPVHPS